MSTQTRIEEILQSILDGNPYGKPPLSRNEALLIEIGQLIQQGFSPEQIEEAVNKYLEEHPVSAGMEYYILTFDGTAFKHDGAVLTFAEIRSKCLDTKHFVYATYENNLYIPQNISTSYVFFDSSYIRSDQAQMHRISINSSEHVQKYDYVLAKQTEVEQLKGDMSALQNADKSATAGQVWTATADGAGWADPAGGEFELIESIITDGTSGRVMRNAEPNGTAYAFRKMIVAITIPTAAESGNLRVESHSSWQANVGASTSGATYCTYYADASSGRIQAFWCRTTGNSSSGSIQTSPRDLTGAYAKIDRCNVFHTSDGSVLFPANTKIEIYAVR